MVKKFTETMNTWGCSQDIRNTNFSWVAQLANSSFRYDILSKTIFSFLCCFPNRWHAPIPQIHDMFYNRRRLAPISKSVIQDMMTVFFFKHLLSYQTCLDTKPVLYQDMLCSLTDVRGIFPTTDMASVRFMTPNQFGICWPIIWCGDPRRETLVL